MGNEVSRHLFDILIMYTEPNASDFDESHTQGPGTVTLPRSCFHDSNDDQHQETCPVSDP